MSTDKVEFLNFENLNLDETLAGSTRMILFMSLNVLKAVEQGIILAWDLSNELQDEESQMWLHSSMHNG